MYEVRIATVFKVSKRFSEKASSIKVSRLGATVDLGNRVEIHAMHDVAPFQIGEKYFMFLREMEWSKPSPYTGIFYYGTTYSGPDSFYRIDETSLVTSGRTALAKELAARGANALRDQLRRAGGGR
jgi:hypothetical protein